MPSSIQTGTRPVVIPPKITDLYPVSEEALVAEIARLTARATPPVVTDLHRYEPEERTDFWSERKVNSFNRGVQAEKLVECREALQRIQNGTFGICCTCGNLIEEGRLIAYPHARNCRECQEKKPKKIW